MNTGEFRVAAIASGDAAVSKLEAHAAARFETLVAEIEPGLRRALVAAYGAGPGREATADALAWAWEHREKLAGIENPGGYLYRVGQTAAKRERRSSDRTAGPDPELAAAFGNASPAFEPRLDPALRRLSPKQRSAVLLVHGWGYPLVEAAELMGVRVSSVRVHLKRGMTKLRADIGADDLEGAHDDNA